MKKIPLLLLLVLTACVPSLVKETAPAAAVVPPLTEKKCDCVVVQETKKDAAAVSQCLESKATETKTVPKVADYGLLKPAQWDEMDGFTQNNNGPI